TAAFTRQQRTQVPGVDAARAATRRGCPLRARRARSRAAMTPPPDLSAVRKIWVRAPNWVGDLVMATAAFARLRAAFPRAEITVRLRPFLRPLLAGTDWFDKIVDIEKARSLRGLWRQVRAAANERFDLAVVLPNSLETGLVPFLARVPLRLGWRQGRSWL